MDWRRAPTLLLDDALIIQAMKSREQIDRLIAEESAELQMLHTAIIKAETSGGGAARLTKEVEEG